MRVIAGDCRGVPLKAVPGMTTRPTTDKVKESLFNILGPYFNGGIVVDLFSGSGSLGIEALSRGMEHAYLVDRDRKAVQTIRENVEKCKLSNKVTIMPMDAKKAIGEFEKNHIKIDMLFLDPPYKEVKDYELANLLIDAGLVDENAKIVCEHDKAQSLPNKLATFAKFRTETYGQIALSFYRLEKE